MQLSLKQLVRDVRVAMDENVTDDGLQFLREVNTLTLDEVIRHQAEAAAQLVLSRADVRYLEGGKSFLGAAVSRMERGVGRVQLPTDYLRFLYFKMSDWDYGVTDYITPDDALYPQQFSRWAGVRGNPHRPIVAIVPCEDGMCVEYFTSNGSVADARYVGMPRLQGAEDDCTLDFPSRLKHALIYMTASLSCQKLGQANEAEALSLSANALMGGGLSPIRSRPAAIPPSVAAPEEVQLS